MPIKLNIEVTSPLTPDDNDLLSGVAVMTLAIANHEMAKAAFPGMFHEDEEETKPEESVESESEHQHIWIAGILAIEDCKDCGERRLAEHQPRPMDVRAN